MTLYLLVSTFLFESSDKFKIVLRPDASDRERMVHGDGTCDYDSNASIRRLLWFCFVPVIILRAIGAIKYHKRDPLDFQDFATKIEIFYHAGFGCWTLISLYFYMKISQNCRDLFVMSMINFQITMILGCFSAVNVLFVSIVICILTPILIYQAWKHYR